METVRYYPKEGRVELFRKPRPKVILPHDVLIKIFFASIANTDLKIINGTIKCTGDLESIVIGRELTGVVRETGDAVTTIKQGDKVAVIPVRGCGICHYCQDLKPQFCASVDKVSLGVNRDGGLAEYIVVSDAQVYKIPANITLEQGILANTMSHIIHSWEILQPISVGEKILIIGIGLHGGLWACLLHLQGYRKVTICEKNRCRIEHVEKLDTGFECITPDELDKRRAGDPNYLFNLVLDCTGTIDAIERAFRLLNKGGKLLLSIEPPEGEVSMCPRSVCTNEFQIIGSRSDPLSFFKGLEYLDAMSHRYLSYESLGIKTYSLRDFREVIDYLQKGVVIKAVFSMAIRCTCTKKEEIKE